MAAGVLVAPKTLRQICAAMSLLSVASAVIVPLHFEGWEHVSESREDIAAAFARAGLVDRLRWPVPGRTIAVA